MTDRTIIILAIVLAAFATGAISYAALKAKYMPESRSQNAKRRLDARAEKTKHAETGGTAFYSRIAPFAHKLIPISKDQESILHKQLMAAGITIGVDAWRGIEALAIAVGVFLGVLAALAFTPRIALSYPVFAFAGGITASMAFRFKLISATKRRKDALERELPSALELLCVSVQAGQTVERGFRTISQRMQGPIADEFGLVDAEITFFGYSMLIALKRMSARCNVPSIDLFVSALSQADSSGAPVGRILKSQAVLASKSRRRKIDEKANTITTKMSVVNACLLLPPLLIIVLAPTMLGYIPSMSGLK